MPAMSEGDPFLSFDGGFVEFRGQPEDGPVKVNAHLVRTGSSAHAGLTGPHHRCCGQVLSPDRLVVNTTITHETCRRLHSEDSGAALSTSRDERAAVGFEPGDLVVGVAFQAPAFLVEHPVVPRAELDQVVEVGGSAV